MTTAVLFDVDFTLIHPGPTFQGEGYEAFCARHGIAVDPTRFESAVQRAAAILETTGDHVYDAGMFVAYTTRIIEGMGGRGPAVERCAAEIYEEWAGCHHFSLYADVAPVLERLRDTGRRIGLISNSHRCLTSFERHFQLEGYFAAAISSSVHGRMKPHPSIFEAALQLLNALPGEAVMVGDSLTQDIAGARAVGMRGILLSRSGRQEHEVDGVPIIRTLEELFDHL